MIRTLIATALTAVALTVPSAPAAHADDRTNCDGKPGLVTPEEYAQIVPGTTNWVQVKAITGFKGFPQDDPAVLPNGYMERAWRVCSKQGWVAIGFQHVRGQGQVVQWTAAKWA